MAQDKKLVSLRELSREIRVPATWLRGEADHGRLPHLRAGKGYLFDLESVREALRARAKMGGSPPVSGEDNDDPL